MHIICYLTWKTSMVTLISLTETNTNYNKSDKQFHTLNLSVVHIKKSLVTAP